MKVITVGRSHNNDIVIDDPYVSKTHCQIVKDDNGRVSIIDTNSRNGVYINGKMAHGNVYLQTSDIVRIGNTTLPWQQYFTESFTPSAPPVQNKTSSTPRNLNAKHSIIASFALALSIIGAIVLLAAIIKLIRSGFPDSYQEHVDTQSEIIRFDGPEPSSCVITLEEDGESYPVYAAEGQVIVLFHEGISHGEAVDVLQRNNAKVIAQIPYWAYYLIEVPIGEESAFVSRLRSLPEIDFVYPNVLEQLCAFSAFVVDNFKVDHGDKVSTMMSESNSEMRITRMDVGTDENHVNTNKAIESVEQFLHNLKSEDGAVINMSFGPGLIKFWSIIPWQNRTLWQDYFVTKSNKDSYIKRYISSLKPWIKLATKYNDKDFIFVKSAGNEGMKELETIISKLINELSLEERTAFEQHFILVSAKDDNKEGDYPNDVSYYNEMVTKADISDMTAQDLHWQGTSFSSPRIAGYIISAAEEFDLSTTSVLHYVRSATKKSEDNVLTYELLREEINNSLSTDNLADDLNELVGTQWMHINKYGQLSCIITFVSENKVHIKNLIRYSNSSNAPIHVQELDNTYTYDQLNKRGIKYETNGNSGTFVYSNNSLVFTVTYNDGRPARMEFYPYFEK